MPVAPIFSGDPPNFIALGYGTGPRCIECRRNVSACHCGPWPGDEPEHFRPGINRDPDVWAGDDDGFVFVERIGPGRIAA